MIDLSRPLNRHFFPAHGPLNACANAGTTAYPMCESLYCAARRFVGIQYSWRKRLHVSDCDPVRPRFLNIATTSHLRELSHYVLLEGKLTASSST